MEIIKEHIRSLEGFGSGKIKAIGNSDFGGMRHIEPWGHSRLETHEVANN